MNNWSDDITQWIFLEHEPVEADAVFIPGNAYVEPAERAAELYLQGLAPLIIVSGKYSKEAGCFKGPADSKYANNKDMTEADFIKRILQEKGVPKEAIICDHEATFTYENAKNIYTICQALPKMPKKVMIICQAFHARRCYMYFQYVFEKEDIDFYVCPVVTQNISRSNWIHTEKGLAQVLGEVRRIGEQFGWMMERRKING